MKKQPSLCIFGLIFVACATTTLGFTREASADMAPWAEIGELVQEEQDVKIEVTAYGNTLEGQELSLERVQGEDSVLIGSGTIFSEENMISSSFWCNEYFLYSEPIAADEFCTTYPSVCLSCPEHENEICIGLDCDECTLVEDNTIYAENVPYESSFCDAYPTYMVDCDNDDQPDCCLACDLTREYHYEFVDECVPPGMTKYILDGALVDEFGGSENEIEVVDAETACEPDSGLIDTETDTNEEQESDPEMDSETESDELMGSDPEMDSETDTDTGEPLSEDSDSATDDSDSETEDPSGDTESGGSGGDSSDSGCSVSGTGASTESGVWQFLRNFL